MRIQENVHDFFILKIKTGLQLNFNSQLHGQYQTLYLIIMEFLLTIDDNITSACNVPVVRIRDTGSPPGTFVLLTLILLIISDMSRTLLLNPGRFIS